MAENQQSLEKRLIQASGREGRKENVIIYRAWLLGDSGATRNHQNRQGSRLTTSASGGNREMQKPLSYAVNLL